MVSECSSGQRPRGRGAMKAFSLRPGIRGKLLLACLGIGLLWLATLGYGAWSEDKEIEDRSRVAAELLARRMVTAVIDMMGDRERLQHLVTDWHTYQQRDIVVVDRQKRILADALPQNVGTEFTHDLGNEVAQSMADGRAHLRGEEPRLSERDQADRDTNRGA